MVILKKRNVALVALAGLSLLITAAGYLLSNDDIILIGLCIFLGLDVKLIDQLIDDESMIRYRRLTFPLAILIPILMGYLAIIHDPVFGMVLGTALGLLLSGKLDHPAFVMAAVGFIVVMSAFVILFNIDIATTSLYLIPLAAFGAFGDEFGHEKVSAASHSRGIRFFFEHRFLLKIIALISVLIDFAEPIHLLGFLCWDISYDVVAQTWEPGENIK